MTLRLCSILLLLPAAVLAQQSSTANPPMSMPGMNHSAPSAIIDGKDHPELIPDSVAYRLYFITVGELPHPTDARKKRQRAFLGKVHGLPQSDSDAVVRVLEDFKVKFASMVAAYNSQVEAAMKAGGTNLPDGTAFLAERDQLVQDTRDRLKLALSAQGMANLDAYVQAEKRAMRITTQEVGQ